MVNLKEEQRVMCDNNIRVGALISLFIYLMEPPEIDS